MVSTRNATRDLGLGRGDAALLPVAAGLRRDGAPRPRRQRYAVGGGRPVQLAGALAVLGVAAAGGEPEAQPDGRGEPAIGCELRTRGRARGDRRAGAGHRPSGGGAAWPTWARGRGGPGRRGGRSGRGRVTGLDELVQRLQTLGFSQYEARAYCALLQKSPANGHEVAKTAGIPTSKVYETLERLHQKGSVLVQRSEPTLWAPVPYRDLVGSLRQRMESTFSAVEQGLAQLGHEQDTALTWSLSGHGHVVDSMRRAIDRVRERPAGDPEDRLALVVGDGEETVLADLGRDRPEGMWTHHPAVALLAAEHLRELG